MVLGKVQIPVGYWTEAPAPCWPPAKPHSLPQGFLHMATALMKLSKVSAKRSSWQGRSTILYNVNMEVPFHHGPLEASHKPCHIQRRTYKDSNMIGGYVEASNLPYHTPSQVLPPNYPSCLPHLPMVTAASPFLWAATGLLGSSLHSIYCAYLWFFSMP